MSDGHDNDPNDPLTRQQLRQAQYSRCVADVNASTAIMAQIPTIPFAVNTLVLAVAKFVNDPLFRGIIFGLAAIWSLLLVVAFDRYHTTGFHRSVFMETIEREAIPIKPSSRGPAAKPDPFLQVKTEKMLDWLDNEVIRREQLGGELKEGVPELRKDVPGQLRRGLMIYARERLALLLLLVIFGVDVGLFVVTVLNALHITSIVISNST